MDHTCAHSTCLEYENYKVEGLKKKTRLVLEYELWFPMSFAIYAYQFLSMGKENDSPTWTTMDQIKVIEPFTWIGYI